MAEPRIPGWLDYVGSARGQRTLAFVVGVGLIVREVVAGGDQPSVYVLAGGLMGLPWMRAGNGTPS